MPRRDYLGLVVRFSCGAIAGGFVGLLFSMLQMGMNAGWLLILVPAVVGGIIAAASDL